jgi:hypothetical protein
VSDEHGDDMVVPAQHRLQRGTVAQLHGVGLSDPHRHRRVVEAHEGGSMRLGQPVFEPGQCLRRELTVVDPLTLHGGNQRVEHEDVVTSDLQAPIQPGGGLSAEQHLRKRASSVVVPRPHEQGTSPRRE